MPLSKLMVLFVCAARDLSSLGNIDWCYGNFAPRSPAKLFLNRGKNQEALTP